MSRGLRRTELKKKDSVEISYIVSLYNRPTLLPVCLASIASQTHQDYEVIVTDNTTDNKIARMHAAEVAHFNRKHKGKFHYIRTAGKIKVSDCYWSAEYGMKQAVGRWLVHPCEDNYYPPEWTQRMLMEAAGKNLDLVLCGISMCGPEPCGSNMYFPIELGTEFMPGFKPSFIVKRSRFPQWLNKPLIGACAGVDRTTLCYMVKDPTIKWGVVRNLFYAHN